MVSAPGQIGFNSDWLLFRLDKAIIVFQILQVKGLVFQAR